LSVWEGWLDGGAMRRDIVMGIEGIE